MLGSEGNVLRQPRPGEGSAGDHFVAAVPGRCGRAPVVAIRSIPPLGLGLTPSGLDRLLTCRRAAAGGALPAPCGRPRYCLASPGAAGVHGAVPVFEKFLCDPAHGLGGGGGEFGGVKRRERRR